MSASPGDPNDYAQLTKDGVIAGALGAGAAISRILLNPEPVSLGWVVRRTVASAGVAVFAGYGLQDQVQSLSLRFACIGLAGAAAPEVLDAGIAWLKGRLGQEVQAVTRKGKPNGKANRRK